MLDGGRKDRKFQEDVIARAENNLMKTTLGQDQPTDWQEDLEDGEVVVLIQRLEGICTLHLF